MAIDHALARPAKEQSRAARESSGRRIELAAALSRGLKSRLIQTVMVIAVFCLIAGLHASNDGLWYQGDSPRHAVNGFFWWDLMTTRPASPVEFAARYYARYPVINPATYPPFFYFLEGGAFRLFGPSPFVARGLVLMFGILAGLYTLAWARRWLGPQSGWAGAFLALVPGMVVWTNAVMLNVPVTAIGIACLYHFRRWRETGSRAQLTVAAFAACAAALTYYQGAIAILICVTWLLVLPARESIRRRHTYWIAAALLAAALPMLFVSKLAPVLFARQLPGARLLTNLATWMFYFKALPTLLSRAGVVLGLAGLFAALLSVRMRREGVYLLTWALTPLLALSILPARDPRYVLLVIPAFVLAGALGLGIVFHHLPPSGPKWQIAALAGGLAAAIWLAAMIRIPEKTGFRAAAQYLKDHAPADAVLYDGYHDGLFGFYVRAMDPQFQRRVVLGQQLIYERRQGADFRWLETANARTTDEVVHILRTQSGCRWIVLEMGAYAGRSRGPQLLRQTVGGPDFEFVRSFPLSEAPGSRIDVYRIVGPIAPVTAVDLHPAAYSSRSFRNVTPVTR